MRLVGGSNTTLHDSVTFGMQRIYNSRCLDCLNNGDIGNGVVCNV